MWLPLFCVCICILYTKIKEKIDDRMRKVIFGSCDKQEDKKYATKQERKFYLFRNDVFYHGALDEYLQCYSSYGCTEFWYYLSSMAGISNRICLCILLRLVPGFRNCKRICVSLPCETRQQCDEKGHLHFQLYGSSDGDHHVHVWSVRGMRKIR